MEEKEIASLCAENNPDAQKELYNRYSGHLFGVCMRYASCRQEALDILHDSFIKIYTSVEKFSWRGPGSLKGWLTRVTINVALEKLRQDAKFKITEISPEVLRYPIPDEEQVREVPMDVLIKFVKELPPGYRAVFNLYVIDGMSHKEIAQKLGINEKSSSSQLLRAKAAIARKINSYKKGL